MSHHNPNTARSRPTNLTIAALSASEINWEKNELGGMADFAMQAEYVRFTHSTLVEGTRISVNPTITMPYLTPGFFFKPKFGMRYVTYGLDRTAIGQPERQSEA